MTSMRYNPLPLLFPILFVFALLGCSTTDAPLARAAPEREQPNVVILFADDMGYGGLFRPFGPFFMRHQTAG